MKADLIVNPARQDRVDLDPIRDPRDLHRLLPGYQPTPLIAAPDLAQQLGIGQLWIKAESWRLELPSFKMLGASWATFRALEERLGATLTIDSLDDLIAAIAPLCPLTLAAATDGNHGRAVARMAKLLGLSAHIFVPADMVAARIAAIESEGASVTVVDGSYDDAVRASADGDPERTLVVSDTSWPGYRTIPGWVIDGYTTIFTEVAEQLDGDVTTVVVPMGVGALGAATVRAAKGNASRKPWHVIGVEPLASNCVYASISAGAMTEVPPPHDSIMAGLNCGLPSEIAWPVLRSGLNAVVAIDDDAAEQAMRLLADLGIAAGETGAAALGALLALDLPSLPSDQRRDLGLESTSRVLVLMTEGITDPAAYQRIVGDPPCQRGQACHCVNRPKELG